MYPKKANSSSCPGDLAKQKAKGTLGCCGVLWGQVEESAGWQHHQLRPEHLTPFHSYVSDMYRSTPNLNIKSQGDKVPVT